MSRVERSFAPIRLLSLEKDKSMHYLTKLERYALVNGIVFICIKKCVSFHLRSLGLILFVSNLFCRLNYVLLSTIMEWLYRGSIRKFYRAFQ